LTSDKKQVIEKEIDVDFDFFFPSFQPFFFFIHFSFFLLNNNTCKIKNIKKNWMGCLPSSAFVYVIELDASTTVRVAKMMEKIYHPSSSSCLVGIT